VPADILAAINGGDLTRHGGIVRDRAGAIVVHLKDAFQSVDTPRAAAQSAAGLSRPLKVIAVGLGAAVLATAGVAVFVATTRGRKRDAGVQAPQCVREFTASLGACLRTASEGRLGIDDVERLIADLDAVEAQSRDGRLTVDFSVGRWRELINLVADYTSRLAAANPASISDGSQLVRASGDDVIVDLRCQLQIQQQIFMNAA
jgi:hypothetical protein